MDLDMIMDVYRLPPAQRESQSLSALVQKCELGLVDTYGDVPSVIVDEEHRGRFCQLPHAALISWLKADNLRVHSESCVVYLLNSWVMANEDESSPEELRQLALNIRVKQLSHTYLYSILPDLPWFKSCLDGLEDLGSY